MRSALLYLCFFLVGVLEANAQGAGTTPGYTEPEIKAAFVLHLIGFITWPDAHEPSVICITEESNVQGALAALLKGRAGTDLTLKILVDEQDLQSCDLLFLSDEAKLPVLTLPVLTDVTPLLTIGETLGFADSGGMVELRRRAGRVELIINVSELQYAGFSASSRLMSLATIVTPGVRQP